MKEDLLPYAIGALLYTPALNDKIAEDICCKKIENLHSLALCMEDSIQDESMAAAEQNLTEILKQLASAVENHRIDLADLPMIFIRIRTPEHMEHVFHHLKELHWLVTGFILPKFDLTNAALYHVTLKRINQQRTRPLYVMPILESACLIQLETRKNHLVALKEITDSMRQYILNIRVGGNDFCHIYGLRRNCRQTIYEIEIVKAALTDIYAVFGRDYVIAGPVWEYFSNNGNEDWKKGLQRELQLDQLNGFIGKTAIHPSQLPVIYHALMVTKTDYEDAATILKWDDTRIAVAKSSNGDRMNEEKVHRKWAKKIIALATLYGIKEDNENA